MSDKIMPLSEAVEGYELFDKMKVQKGSKEHAKKSAHVKLTRSSGIRGTEVAANLHSSGLREERGKFALGGWLGNVETLTAARVQSSCILTLAVISV